MNHDHDHGHMGMDMGMKMYFHSGLGDKNVLIYGWDVDCGGKLTGTLIVVLLTGIFYEYVKFLRVACRRWQLERGVNSDLSRDPDTPKSWWKEVRIPLEI